MGGGLRIASWVKIRLTLLKSRRTYFLHNLSSLLDVAYRKIFKLIQYMSRYQIRQESQHMLGTIENYRWSLHHYLILLWNVATKNGLTHQMPFSFLVNFPIFLPKTRCPYSQLGPFCYAKQLKKKERLIRNVTGRKAENRGG